MRALHEELIQQQRYKKWTEVMGALFPAYLHLKKITNNWTSSNTFDNFLGVLCSCTTTQHQRRQVDLIDLMGKYLSDDHAYL